VDSGSYLSNQFLNVNDSQNIIYFFVQFVEFDTGWDIKFHSMSCILVIVIFKIYMSLLVILNTQFGKILINKSLLQAFVKINYATNGYADVTLKGLTGNLLYHKKINGNFWFEGSDHYGPKWGLYRAKSSIFNEADYMFFQNVQIWQK
jgi:hypothetical protein